MSSNRNNYQRRNAKIAASFRTQKNPGVDMLTKAADSEVQKKCDKIAQGLVAEAIKGNASATRLLVDLAEGADWLKNEEAVSQVLKLVESWSKEPKIDDQPGEMPAGVIAPQGNIASSHDEARSAFVN
jgi:hypothetical protein